MTHSICKNCGMPYSKFFGGAVCGQHCSKCRINFAGTATIPQLIPNEPLTKEKLFALLKFAKGDEPKDEKIITILPNGQIVSYPVPNSIFNRQNVSYEFEQPDLTNMYGDGI